MIEDQRMRYAFGPELLYDCAHAKRRSIEDNHVGNPIAQSFFEGDYEQVLERVKNEFLPVRRINDKEVFDPDGRYKIVLISIIEVDGVTDLVISVWGCSQ